MLFSVYVTGNSDGNRISSAHVHPLLLRDTIERTEGFGENVALSEFVGCHQRYAFTWEIYMRTKIVLFNPIPSTISRRKGVLPLALLSIARGLDVEKYEIVIIDEAVEIFPEEVVEGALCVGISAMIGYQINSALKLAKRIRTLHPKVPLVWGGWHPSILPKETVASDFVDYVIRGQGEITFFELINALEGNRALDDILGLTYKVKGEITSNPDRHLSDPNGFPPLPYHLIDMEKYIHASEFGARTVTYLSSIGCPFSCGFCAEQVVYGKRWLPLSSERVISDFKSLKEQFKVDSIIINDSNFFTNQKRVVEICEKIMREELNLKWGNANGRTDQLVKFERRTWQLMQESGLQCILTGAETYDDGILEIINKKATVEDTISLANIASEFSVKIKFSFMIGLPIANRKVSMDDEFDNVIDFINKLYEISNKNHFLLFLYTPFPGTPLYKRSIELGYESPDSLEAWGGFLEGLNHASTPWTSMAMAEKVYQVNFYFPFISNAVLDIVNQYPLVIRWILIPFERMLYMVMRFRIKHKFFDFPVEFNMIKLIFKLFKRKI